MSVTGDNVGNILDEVQAISGVETAATIKYTHGEIMNLNDSRLEEWENYADWCRLGIPSEEYMTKFQGAYEFISGNLPETVDEFVLNYGFAENINARLGDLVTFTQYDEFNPVFLYLEVVGIYSLVSNTGELMYYDYYNYIEFHQN